MNMRMSKNSFRNRSRQNRTSFYLNKLKKTKKDRLNKSKNSMFSTLKIIRRPLLQKLKKKYLLVYWKGDRQSKCINCLKRRPSGVNSTRCTVLLCSFSEAFSWLFHSIMWYAKPSVSQWDNMPKNITSVKTKSTFSASIESPSWLILMMKYPGNSSLRQHV